MSCIECGKKICTFLDECKFQKTLKGCQNCHNCQNVQKADQLASGGGGGCKIKKKSKPKPNPRFEVCDDHCISCGIHVTASYIVKDCRCILHKRPLSNQTHNCSVIEVCPFTYIERPNLPQRDINTISSDKDLQETKGKVSWMKNGKLLGVYERSFMDDNGASFSNKLYLIHQFSNKNICDEELFPPAQVAISSSSGCGSATTSMATVKVDSSATAKVGGSATANVDSSSTTQPHGLLTL